MGNRKELSGEKFGRLTVLRRAPKVKNRTAWFCMCECGSETIALTWTLTTGHTQSCGCYHRDQTSASSKVKKLIHGGCQGGRTRLYRIWCGMKQRCSDVNYHNYSDYGGRGISVCTEWVTSFESFQGWALSNGYKDDLSIDRKEPNGNYEPNNCRWATNREQINNRRASPKYEFEGQSNTLGEWAEIYGISYGFLWQRVHRQGMSLEEAIKTPIKGYSHG